ncbi:MAG: XRE family transcriptional regulator [Candidatus Acidiferrales bacterium]
MARNFKELRAKMSPPSRGRSKAIAQRMLSELALDELREALDLTQESLAEALNVTQASVSKMERRSDMYLSTLRKIIEAMGGKLEIIALMPDGPVRIRQFNKVRKREDAAGEVSKPRGVLTT